MSDTVAASYTFVGDYVSARRRGVREGGGGGGEGEGGRRRSGSRDWRPIGSWGLGSSIGDLANTARLCLVLYCAGPFINHGLRIFQPRIETDERPAETRRCLDFWFFFLLQSCATPVSVKHAVRVNAFSHDSSSSAVWDDDGGSFGFQARLFEKQVASL